MKKIALLSMPLIISLGLSACQPMLFGMPEAQFKSLPHDQQNKVIASYNERKRIEKQNEPLMNFIGIAAIIGRAAV